MHAAESKSSILWNRVPVNIRRNGIWLTLPPLIFSLSLMNLLPNALTAAEFNGGIPSTLLITENILRILAFAIPLLFSVRVSSKRQKWGLALYLAGLKLYFASYGTQNFFPGNAWSVSFIGFMGSAFLNVFWMIGLGLMGDKINFQTTCPYQSAFYVAPIILFIAIYSLHAAFYYQGHHWYIQV